MAPRYTGTVDAFRRIAAEEGMAGFFQGLGPSIVRAAIINGCGIASYDHSKHIAMRVTGSEDGVAARIIGSLVSGMVSAVVSTPLDVVKTRLVNQSAKTTGILYTGMIDCAIKTVRNEGFLALYKGFVPSYTRLAPWQFVFFLTFEQINDVVFGKSL